jgi:cell division protein FtsW (lipid II flippase)
MEAFKKTLAEWNNRTDTFTKTQAGYAVLAVAIFILAGIVSLFQYNLGQTLLFFSALLALTFIANGVMSAVIRTYIVSKDAAPVSKARKK